MMQKRWRGAGARLTGSLLALGLVLLAGCGRDEQPGGDQDTAGQVPAEAGESDSAAAYLAQADPAAQLAEVQKGAPEDVVRLLLQWDTAGLRFEGPYADALTQLYCYVADPKCQSDEPAYDFAVVVKGYTLDPVLVADDTAQFVITFDELGMLWPDRMEEPTGTPPETLSLRRMDTRWRIVGVGSQMPPHLSPNGALHRYRGVQPDSEVIARWLEDR